MGERQKYSLGSTGIGLGYAIGIVLISGGVVLFLDNLGIFPFPVKRLFWPFIFLALGGSLLRASRSAATVVWAAACIAAGLLFLMNAFDVLHVTGQIVWALALIAAGVVMLICRADWPGGMGEPGSRSPDRLQEFAMFTGCRRKVDTANFEGGVLSCIFGGIEIDLRRAHLTSPNREAVIEANAAFGGIEIRIPDDWRVSLQGTAVFGAYEDKTLPTRPEPGIQAPVLIVRGGAVFGGISIQN